MRKAVRNLAASFLAAALATRALHADPTDDEIKALKAVEQSYKDGAFDLCNNRAVALLKKFPHSELAPQAELLQAQALYQLGRSDAVLAALNLSASQMSPAQWADTLFWQAQSLLELSRWPDAAEKFRALIALKDANGHADDANLGLAWALFNQGHEGDALPIIQGLIKSRGSDRPGQQAHLLLAKIELAKKQYADAIATLEALLATNPDKDIAFDADYWLGETYSKNNQPDKAAAIYQRITGDPSASPRTTVALAFLGLGQAQHAMQQNDQAMLAYEQGYRLTENPATQLEAFRSYLACARSSGQLPEAISKLQEFAKSSDVAAPGALFAIGSALADDHQDDKAIGILESLLVAYGASPFVPAANEILGELYSRANKPDQAVRALQNCIASATTDPDLLRKARLQLGYVLLNQLHDYAGAATQFGQIDDGTDANAENASYYYLLALAHIGKLDAFLKPEAEFEKRFPKSNYLQPLALAKGRLLANNNKTDDAKAVYQKAIALGAGPSQEELLRSLGDLQYQTNDLEGALATSKQIVAQFPSGALAAAQRSVMISYDLKKITDDQVESQLVDLAHKYNNNAGAPEAYFNLGEFYFYREDYVRAQDAFQQLIANYPNSGDVDKACYYAGMAAFAHGDYPSAKALLDKVPDTSSFKPEARLMEARVLQQQHEWDQAVTFCDAVLATEKSGERFVQASLLKGQCLFALGSQDPTNYSTAFAAFDQIVKSKDGTIAERNQADVQAGACLEKMGKTDDALGRYLDVVFGRVTSDDSGAPQPPEFSWQFKAGIQAGSIREKRKDWRGAIEIYKRLEQIGGAHAQEFHDLVNKLRRDNYIYE